VLWENNVYAKGSKRRRQIFVLLSILSDMILSEKIVLAAFDTVHVMHPTRV